MKKTIASLLILTALCSFGLGGEKERTFTVTFKENELNVHWQKLDAIKQIAESSNLPHQQVVFITKSIDSLQMVIAADVRKHISDSSKTKK